MPARPHSAATFDACTSDPPASGSSRSRHARIAMRRSPAPAAMSPSFATTSSLPDPVPGTGRNLRVRTRADSCSPDATRVPSGQLRSLGGKGGPWPGSPASARWRARPPTRCSRCTMPGTARSRRGSARASCSTSAAASATQTARLARADRLVVGADYSAPTVVETGRGATRRSAPALRGHGRRAPRRARRRRSTRSCRRTSSSTS